MPLSYAVKKGDCISSIALVHGFLPETIWNHSGNAKLKQLRVDMNVLYEGDTVVIPDLEKKSLDCATDNSHKFVRYGVPAYIRFQLRVDGVPLANLPYVLDVEGVMVDGNTDSAGLLEARIPPDARTAVLTIGKPGKERQFKLDLGGLDPIDTVRGVQARLTNLGFTCGELTGEMNEETQDAILNFQEYINHPNPTGELDDQTRTTLKTLHDNEE